MLKLQHKNLNTTKFCMPFNGDPNLVDIIISKYSDHVSSLYGSLGKDAFGGGRALNPNQESTIENVKSLTSKLRNHGIDFNYVINNTDMLNREFLPQYRKTFDDFLENLWANGVKIITLSNFFFIEYTKHHFKDIKISASVNLKTRSVEEVEFLVELGCEEITLHYDILKNSKTLKKIRDKFPNIDFKLIVNDVYIMNCPWQKGHTRMQGAHSRNNGFNTPYFSYYRNKCVNLRHYKPDEVFKAMWIPPEQLYRYEDLGYNHFKLLDRLASTEWNIRALNAYLNKKSLSDTETILGTCGDMHTNSPVEPLKSVDPPYPRRKLEVIPSINTDNKTHDKVFEFFLDDQHPQRCGSCQGCSLASDSTLNFSDSHTEQAKKNNQEWQDKITKLEFIQNLQNYSVRIKYE